MATSTKKDVEILLQHIKLSTKPLRLKSTHLLKATLVWPRMGVSQKTAEKELRLAKGEWNLNQADWCSRVLFKETVEGNFGLQFGVTIPLDKAKLQEMGRFVVGNLFKTGGTLADDAIPGTAGEAVEQALKFLAKELTATYNIPLLAKTTFNLEASQLPMQGEPPITLEADLLSEKPVIDSTGIRVRNTKTDTKTIGKIQRTEHAKLGTIAFTIRTL